MLRTRTGGAVAPLSPVDQRKATLNFFMAAYCGPDGDRYTKLGRPIAWSDLSGPNEIGLVVTYEAVWGPNGAVCLNTPRMVSKQRVACKIQSCKEDVIDNWPAHGWLLSGNPPPL
jgi:hypothetical protein